MKQSEIESMFNQISKHRSAIAAETKDLVEQLDALTNQIGDIIKPHAEIIDALQADISTVVLENQHSCTSSSGSCTFVKGREGAVKWDDAALMGFVSASPDNETILQFRSEKPDGKPSTRFKFVNI